jgi:hypothetical protein
MNRHYSEAVVVVMVAVVAAAAELPKRSGLGAKYKLSN